MFLTPEQIAKRTEHKNGLANRRAINKLVRAQDQSELWPILNKFNATERAIRQARNVHARANGPVYGLEYSLLLDSLISAIVNNNLNWD